MANGIAEYESGYRAGLRALASHEPIGDSSGKSLEYARGKADAYAECSGRRPVRDLGFTIRMADLEGIDLLASVPNN